MARNHRFFHRRHAHAVPHVVTIHVEVVVIVDTHGNTIAEETKPPQTYTPTPQATSEVSATATAVASVASVPSQVVPSVTAVPGVPTVAAPSLPSVPAVPPFPSDLVVPSIVAYPWHSGVHDTQAVSSSSSTAPVAASSSARQSSLPPIPTKTLSSNSTTVLSTVSSILSASSFSSLDSTSPTSTHSGSHGLASSDTSFASISATSTVFKSITTTADTATSTDYGGGGEGSPADSTAPPPATTAVPPEADADAASTPLETPQVVGSVVGSLAGAAFILAIILILIRRHRRRKGGALQLTGDDYEVHHEQPTRQLPTHNSIVPIAFLKRFSGMSRSTVETTLSGGERSFQRVSGRKLPSAFSEGMTSDQFPRGGNISGSSFYQDDQGTYGGAAMAKDFGKEIGDTHTTRESGQMNIRPGPARTPIIRHPDDDPFFDKTYLSPPQSPNVGSPGMNTLGRSLQSADGSRSSRFTENV